MKIIVVGIGKIGTSVIKYLSQEDHDIVAVDVNSQIVQEIVDSYDVKGLCGNGCIGVNLEDAGVSTADILIAVTPKDEHNMLCCMLARAMGAKHTIARVRDPEYFDQIDFINEMMGINVLVNPEEELARAITRILSLPTAMKVSSFAGGRAELVSVTIPENCDLDGLRLTDIAAKYHSKVLIAAVSREDGVFIPSGNFQLKRGDVINITASHSDLVSFLKHYGILKHKVRTVMIIGGGRVGYYLAKRLEQERFKVKIIERDLDRCIELKSMLSSASIIHADGTDKDILELEGFDSMGACVAVTDNDEKNIVVSLYAKRQNIAKIVTKVEDLSYSGMLEDIELESVVSPYQVTAWRILAYVRAQSVPEGSRVISMSKIADDAVECLEFSVEGSSLIGLKIKDMRLKENTLIACIVRNRKIIIPVGDTEIADGDRVIVVVNGQHLSAIDDILDKSV